MNAPDGLHAERLFGHYGRTLYCVLIIQRRVWMALWSSRLPILCVGKNWTITMQKENGR